MTRNRSQYVALAFSVAIAALGPVPWGVVYVFPLIGALGVLHVVLE